jgi:hypothetical protein
VVQVGGGPSLNPTDIDDAYLKLKALCAGARLLREKYG